MKANEKYAFVIIHQHELSQRQKSKHACKHQKKNSRKFLNWSRKNSTIHVNS